MTAALDLCLLSLEDVAAMIASKQTSPVEVTEAVLARIERLNPKLNAYLTLTPERALAEARDAEREITAGRYRGPLHGVPIAHKDLFATNGVRTTAGSKILSEWVPDFDATVVTRLAEAGAVSLGKLGMHEWAFGTTSVNEHHGDVHNPWNADHVPGGSSGGSGAATAAGLAYATTGSDTGGSIRTPASLCGCVGLMPTYGRASLHGAVTLAWALDHPGPLTRTVRDAAIVLQAISGYDPLDPASANRPAPDFLDGIDRGARGLRVGVPKQYFWDDVDAEVGSLVRKAIDDLGAAGASIIEVEYPHAQEYWGAVNVVLLTEAAAYHEPTYPSRKGDYSAEVAAFLETGRTFTGVRFASAMHRLLVARAGEADAPLDGVDVLAVPTTSLPAPSIASAKQRDPSTRLAALPAIFDFTGQPAISVPCGLTSSGLPVGITFAARMWDEASVLRAARAYEMVRGTFPAPPDARADLAEAEGLLTSLGMYSSHPPAGAPAVRLKDVESPATMRSLVAPRRSFASGRYMVQRVLGEGGQKVVYLVHDGALDRECALSMIKSELLDDEDVLRLRREAQAMARLGAHSNIVSVFDFGEEEGTPYLVCEYVPGGDLHQELSSAGGSLPLERALAIAGDIARALATAHGRGIVHRDLKPANVWLNDDGSAKLGDFGLAFSLDRSRLTMPGIVMGTAAYMAPEQALGEPVTARSDLYSLGTLLYQMACGQPPFADENATAVIAQHINALPVAPSKRDPLLPPSLDALVLRLLAKSPDERPSSAAAVGVELRQIAQSL